MIQLIYAALIYWLLYYAYIKFLKKPPYIHPKFKSIFPVRKFGRIHALNRPYIISQDILIDAWKSELGDIGIYSLYTYLPWKWNTTNKWIMIQVKNTNFHFEEVVCVTRDINDSFWSNLFTTTLIPILFLWPFIAILFSEWQNSIYTIPFIYKPFTIPLWFLLLIWLLLLIGGLKYIFSSSYKSNRIVLENQQFEKILDVFSYNPINARRILTPEKLLFLQYYFSKQHIHIEDSSKSYQDPAKRHTQSITFEWDSMYFYCANYSGTKSTTIANEEIQKHLSDIHQLMKDLSISS